MDIHRSRFVPYPSSAINALAFSHAEPEHGHQEPESLRLAIGRANGNIEIWNPNGGAWLQEKVFYGGKDRSVEGLVWTQEPDQKDAQNKTVHGRLRLFSIGYSSSVTEWDLATGLPARSSNGNHSEVWCFAAQPRQKKAALGNSGDSAAAHQKIVAGCADGTIVLLSTEDGDLTFDRFVSRATNKKARALSITYKDRDIVLAGFADSTIRVFDTRNGNAIRNISLGGGPHGGPKEILIWKVKCLPNGDFVSGDSTGEIRIYSGKNYAQLQRISGHEADVLDLAVSRDGNSIFSAGMDRRTCFYSGKKSAQKVEGHSGKWRKVSHQRYHEHDVKALATYEGDKLSIVVSGGIDTQPVVVPLREFGKTFSRGLPSLPPSPPLVSAPHARLLVSWWNTEIRIWRVKAQKDGAEKPKVVARLALKGDENIASVSLSQDGRLLAVSSLTAVKLFELIQPTDEFDTSLRIRKLDMPTIAGARLVKVAADGKWLATVSATNVVRFVRIVDIEDGPRVLDTVHRVYRLDREETPSSSLVSPSGGYERSIAHADFSGDGNVFAVVDLAGFIDSWVLEGHEDSTAPETDIDKAEDEDADDESDDDEEEQKEQVTFLGQRWIRNPSAHLLPRLDSTPVLLSFQPNSDEHDKPEPNGNPAVHPTRNNPHPHSHELPSKEYRLLVVSAEHQLYLFDIMAGRLSEWSRRNPVSSYPREYRQLDLPAKGCVWDVNSTRQRVWLYGEKWLFMFDLSRDFSISDADGTSSRKRKRGSKDTPRKSGGAGDAIPAKQLPVSKMRKFESKEEEGVEKAAWIDLHGNDQSDSGEDEIVDDSQPLATLRRGETQDEVKDNDESKELMAGGEVGEIQQRKSNEPWWHTLKYRPILGILPVGDSEGAAPEVVLVERPVWELDLPPRFVGSHEQ